MKTGARGFTLLELTLALGILVVVSGLVITRVGAWSPRQRVIATANLIGNTFSHYRELARNEERLFAIVLEPDNKKLSVYAPAERQMSALNSTSLVRQIEFSGQLVFEGNSGPSHNAKVFFLDRKGIVSDFQFFIQQGDNRILVRADVIANQMNYEEK